MYFRKIPNLRTRGLECMRNLPQGAIADWKFSRFRIRIAKDRELYPVRACALRSGRRITRVSVIVFFTRLIKA